MKKAYNGTLLATPGEALRIMTDALEKVYPKKEEFMEHVGLPAAAPITWKLVGIKKETIMERLERKMARFVELSKKFTRLDAEMLKLFYNIKSQHSLSGDVNMTYNDGLAFGDCGEIDPSSRKKITEDAMMNSGLKNIKKEFDEWNEFQKLQEELSNYFKAAAKL